MKFTTKLNYIKFIKLICIFLEKKFSCYPSQEASSQKENALMEVPAIQAPSQEAITACKIFSYICLFLTSSNEFLAGPFTFSPDQVGSQQQIVTLTTSKNI